MSDANTPVKRTPSSETTAAIRDKYQEVLDAQHKAVIKTVEFGKMLIEVKDNCPHGFFGSYIETNFDFTQRTAQRWMKLASDFSKLTPAEATRVSHLSLNEAMRVIGSTTASATELDTKTRRKVLNTAEKDKLSIGEAERLVERRARKPKPATEANESVQPPERVCEPVAEQVIEAPSTPKTDEWEEVEDQQPARWDYEHEVRETVCSWAERVREGERHDLASYLVGLANEIVRAEQEGGVR